MRIFFFLSANVYPYVVGGMELFNHHLIKVLSKNHKLGIVSTVISSEMKNDESTRWYALKECRPRLIFFGLQYLIFLFSQVRKKQDIVIFPFATYGGWYLWYYYIIFLPVSLVLRKRLVIVVHSGAEVICRPYWFYKFIFQNSTVVGVGSRISEFYRREYQAIIDYIPSLVPLESSITSKSKLRDEFSYDYDEVIFLYVGSFRRIKNVSTILNAFSLLSANYLVSQKVKLICIGTGETKLDNEQFVISHELQNVVYFLGEKSRKEVSKFYKLSDALIVASDHESLGQTLIEALYNKLPIIASEAVANNAFLTSKNAYLFAPGDVNGLAFKIKNIVENPSNEIAENGLLTFNKYFSYQTMLLMYENLFTKIAKT